MRRDYTVAEAIEHLGLLVGPAHCERCAPRLHAALVLSPALAVGGAGSALGLIAIGVASGIVYVITDLD
ncbi:MAG TPA: hypothetical protein VGC92_01415 [Phenylobacterium sp.]